MTVKRFKPSINVPMQIWETRNYYGWHIFEGRHKHVAEGWQTVVIKYTSMPIDLR